MTTIHMDTDQVRNLAQQLDQYISSLSSYGSSLRSTGGKVSIAWQGGEAEAYCNRFRSWLRNYENQVQELENLTLRISREIDEWMVVDTERPFGRWHDEKTIFGFVGDAINTLDTGLSLAAAAFITSQVKAGTEYAGEIKIYGPVDVKDAAGLSGALTHSGAVGFAENLADNAEVGPLELGLGALEVADKGVEDWARYDKDSERVAAVGVDTAFVAAKTWGSVIFQSWFMDTVGVVALGAMATAGAPALLVVGAGFAIWYGSGFLFNFVADSAYGAADNGGLKDAIVQGGGQLIDAGVDLAVNAANEAAKVADSAMNSVINGIASLF